MIKKFQLYPGLNYKAFIQFIKISRPNKKMPGLECHHILPKCFGGDNSISNLIWLTKAEHVEAHRKLFLENLDSISMFCAYNAAAIFNKKECTEEELEALKKMKSAFMKQNNPMFNTKHRETLSQSKLGEKNSACKPDQRIALYSNENKDHILKVFYSAKEAANFVYDNSLTSNKSWQSLATCIRHACKGKTKHAGNKYWGYISDNQYREILLEEFNNAILQNK